MQSASLELLLAAIDSTNDGVVIAEYCGDVNPIIALNASFEKISGYPREELLGRDCGFLKGNDRDQEAIASLTQAVKERQPCTVTLRNYTKSGRMFWNEVSLKFFGIGDETTHIISIHKDITRECYIKSVLDKVNLLYREMSKRLEYTNETDRLTQLKNRGHLSTRGEFMLGAAKREKLRMHTILVDVDNFKVLNTLGGPTLGDECLISLAKIINQYFCRATDIATRLCDDEFVIVCIEDDDQRIIERAQKLRDEIRNAPVTDLKGITHEISVSIGIYSVTPDKNTTIEDMINNAGQLVFQGSHGLQDCIAHFAAEQNSHQHYH